MHILLMVQARKSSPRPTKSHADNLVVRANSEGFLKGESHLLYPDYDVLKDDTLQRPASKLNTIKDSTSKVTDILRALHIAKLSIQRDSSPKTPHSPNTYTATSERRYGQGHMTLSMLDLVMENIVCS